MIIETAPIRLLYVETVACVFLDADTRITSIFFTNQVAASLYTYYEYFFLKGFRVFCIAASVYTYYEYFFLDRRFDRCIVTSGLQSRCSFMVAVCVNGHVSSIPSAC